MKLSLALLFAVALSGVCAARPSLDIERTGAELTLRGAGRHLASYILKLPPNSGLPLEAGGYLKAGKPLALRYRIVTFDGAVPVELMNDLAKELAPK